MFLNSGYGIGFGISWVFDDGHFVHTETFDIDAVKLFGDGAGVAIESATAKRIFGCDRREMYSVEPLSMSVDEGAEVHALSVMCGRVFHGHEIAYDRHHLAHIIR